MTSLDVFVNRGEKRFCTEDSIGDRRFSDRSFSEVVEIPSWYKSLSEYFPPREMKSFHHMNTLKNIYPNNYIIDHTEDYVLVTFELDEIIFVEYLLVTGNKRGNGIGSKILQKLQNKDKMILLEIEYPDENNIYTIKRLNFYNRAGFSIVKWITHESDHLFVNEKSKLSIMMWGGNEIDNHYICEIIKCIYNALHAFKSNLFYDRKAQDVDEVIKCTCES